MEHLLELAYLGIEVRDRGAFESFLAEVIGLVPGDDANSASSSWMMDDAAQRLVVVGGDSDDVQFMGFEAASIDAFNVVSARLAGAGFELHAGSESDKAARHVADLVHTVSPWGPRVELVHGLSRSSAAIDMPLVPGGFVTAGVGFGHAVFGTLDFDESVRFLTDGLGLRQSDWIDTDLGGIELEVRFYHCNRRHHSVALGRAPFELPKKLHHLMVEVADVDDVGRAYDRAIASGLTIANGLGRHDNDAMFSFYVESPAGVQVEVGHGARIITDAWDDNRRYDRISRWGHQPLPVR